MKNKIIKVFDFLDRHFNFEYYEAKKAIENYKNQKLYNGYKTINTNLHIPWKK